MIFYNEKQAEEETLKDNTLVFELINSGYLDVVDKVLKNKKFNINVKDKNGNNPVMSLVLHGNADVAYNHLLDKKLDVNAQNKSGNTLAHLITSMNYIKLMDRLKRRKDLHPNTLNNNNETILDKCSSIYSLKTILSDKRFNNINLISFRNLIDNYIENESYGKKSKIENFNIIISNLSSKKFNSTKMNSLVLEVKESAEDIKEELEKGKCTSLENLLSNYLYL